MEHIQRKRLLLIDDDPFIVTMLTILLSKSTYEIITASDGQHAVEIFTTQAIDVIIVDLLMPVMGGLDFLRWLRLEAKAGTPTLVLTGMSNPDTEEQAMEAGASALLYKPVKIPDLIAKIQELEQLQ